jgi:hypothetical protein
VCELPRPDRLGQPSGPYTTAAYNGDGGPTIWLQPDSLLPELQATLEFARSRIPRYRDPAYAVRIDTFQDLGQLPFVERTDLVADPASFASGTEWPMGVTYSSSTTGRLGVARWHSAAELEAQGTVTGSGPPDAALVIHPNDQGPAMTVPGQSNVIFGRLFYPWHFDLVHDQLRDGWPGPLGTVPIRLLHAYNVNLRLLTTWFEQRDIDPASFGVTSLEGYGAALPVPWRDRLRAAWNADYQDLYGLSEVKLSSARQCPICHAYHHTMPIVAEVVDPITRQPLSDGVGELVLTELVPYAQAQVLVRYLTGDLVEIAEPCIAFGAGFHLVGRASRSAVIERPAAPPVVVGELQVIDACSRLPDIAYGIPSWAPWGIDCGSVRCHVVAFGKTIAVSAALRYPRDLFPKRVQDIADTIDQTLRSRVAGLRQALDAGDAELAIRLVGVDTELEGASLV